MPEELKPFPEIVGNESLRTRLAEDIRNDTLSHAYILEGPEGCGKHTLALQLAAAMACENKNNAQNPLPCSHCPACRKILAGKSPDIITVTREGKATLGVEIIRQLRSDIHIRPNDLDVKVYIIEDAHTMTVQAQNAFLLTLEEPPPFVKFLLLCESAEPLLETIKSRAPVLRMQPVRPEDMDTYLCQKDARAAKLKATSKEEWQELLLSAHGCIGRALTLLEPKSREVVLSRRHFAKEWIQLLLQSPRDSAGKAVLMVETIGKNREEVNRLFLTMEEALRDLLTLKKDENAPLLFFTDRDDALSLSDRLGASQLLHLWEAAEEARLAVFFRNANIRLTWMDFVLKAGLVH